jgi:RNA polymerase sigma factor (sigma-70 family)
MQCTQVSCHIPHAWMAWSRCLFECGWDDVRATPGDTARSTMLVAETFASTLAAARAGSEWAWTAIYKEFAPSVVGFLRAQGTAEPEDLTGEVFLQVVRDLPCFDGDEASFRAWVLTIAHHRLVDFRRYSSRRPVEPAKAEIIVRRGPAGDAEEDALEALANKRVRELIGRLPPAQREVLLLRVLGGMTIEQVSGAIGKRLGAVKALQRRGLAGLKRELSREGALEGVPF